MPKSDLKILTEAVVRSAERAIDGLDRGESPAAIKMDLQNVVFYARAAHEYPEMFKKEFGVSLPRSLTDSVSQKLIGAQA